MKPRHPTLTVIDVTRTPTLTTTEHVRGHERRTEQRRGLHVLTPHAGDDRPRQKLPGRAQLSNSDFRRQSNSPDAATSAAQNSGVACPCLLPTLATTARDKDYPGTHGRHPNPDPESHRARARPRAPHRTAAWPSRAYSPCWRRPPATKTIRARSAA
jgi:hypothetical protein